MQLSVSTLPPQNREEMLEYVKSLEGLDIDYIHVDVMDGIFVPQKTFDYIFLPKIKKATTKPLDVHLMVERPQDSYKYYIKRGADILTLHYEPFKGRLNELINVLKDIRHLGKKAGLSIKVTTLERNIFSLLRYVDVLLLMSVKVGKSGQNFDLRVLNKIDKVSKFIRENNLSTKIEVDGGINEENIELLKIRPVDIVAVGNYIYKAQNRFEAVRALKE